MKRLIDAIELKKAIEEKGSRYSLDEIIDMAPTEAFNLGDITEEDIKQFLIIWQRATSKGVILEPERPRGKWEEDWREDLDVMSKKGWRCSFCKYRTTYGKSNFCMNCGADMRTEGEP